MCHGQMIDHAIRKARKPRRCVECRREILPGERYEHQVSVDGRDFNVWDACASCATKNAALWSEIGDDMCYVSSLRETWREMIRDLGAGKVREMYRKAKVGLFGAKR